jgi:DNA polymerase III alpha subunit|tara:strand:- start:377 stop:889 length:513 start_codon:yes stop_codon:yes gene_type:complete
MNVDEFGVVFFSSDEVADLLYKDPTLDLRNFKVKDALRFNNSVAELFADIPALVQYRYTVLSVDEFDDRNQSTWFMPDEYKNLDIAEHILSLCTTDAELQRVGNELLLYQDRELFNLLRFLKYFVDTMRQNNILWGVGRGSSVSSYVLYLLGIHKINSMYYELDIEEFLK